MVRLKAGACAVLIACVYLAVRAQPPARRPDNPGAQATKLHRNAESQFLSRRWGQAGPLLEQFIKEYPTHEHVPLAYLQLAHCAWQQGEPVGHEAALDEVIKRFPGSAAWFCAYGAKLKMARRQGDREKYLAVVGALLRRNGELPLTLSDDISRTFKDYFSDAYYVNERVLPTHPRFATPPRSPRRKTYPWVLDLVWAGDTPDRARQVLRLMVRTLRNRDGELPCDWEFANVTLLRQSGQVEKAERTFQGYLKEWGDDPRAIGLWIFRIRHALANEDSETAKSGYDHLVRTYPGYGSLGGLLFDRLGKLAGGDEYERFVEIAREYRKHWATGETWRRVAAMWVRMARRTPGSGEDSRSAQALKMLGEFDTKGHLRTERDKLFWRIDLNLDMGRTGEAVALAARLAGEKQWSADSFKQLHRYADRHHEFAKLVTDARKKWGIPTVDPDSEAAKMLGELRRLLADDRPRHADELGDEILAKHPDDASTIEAVRALCEYNYRKVHPEQRDKWMDRMVARYPHHPLTESVLVDQMTTERAAKRYGRLGAAVDALIANFPGALIRGGWYDHRSVCFDDENDVKGKASFARKHLTAGVQAGDQNAIRVLFRAERDLRGDNTEALGDVYHAVAAQVAGTPLEARFLYPAWSIYYYGKVHPWANLAAANWTKGLAVTRQLQSLKADPEVRWKTAFADLNLLAHRGAAGELLRQMGSRFSGKQRYRDLSLRLNMHKVGETLGAAGMMSQTADLAARLRKMCFTARDTMGIELMLAGALRGAQQYEPAADRYLKLLYAHRAPALRYDLFAAAMICLSKAESPRYIGESNRYIAAISAVQELVPGRVYEQGTFLRYRDAGAMIAVYRRLLQRYPASEARDKLEAVVYRHQQQSRGGSP